MIPCYSPGTSPTQHADSWWPGAYLASAITCIICNHHVVLCRQRLNDLVDKGSVSPHVFLEVTCMCRSFPTRSAHVRRSPMWVLMCTFRLLANVNPFPLSLHVYGRSPVWVLMCFSGLPAWVNPFPYSVHVYGRSPVWVLVCPFRWPSHVNPFPHSVHVYRRSPEWVLMCLFRWPACVNPFPH